MSARRSAETCRARSGIGRAPVVQRGKEPEAVGDRESEQFGDVHARDADGQELRLEPAAAARPAVHLVHEGGHGLAARVGVLALVLLAHELEQARPGRRESMRAGPGAALVLPLDVERSRRRLHRSARSRARSSEVGPRARHVQARPRRGGRERRHVLPVRVAVEASRLVTVHGAAREGFRRIGHEAIRIAGEQVSQTPARRARPGLGVRREHRRRERGRAAEVAARASRLREGRVARRADGVHPRARRAAGSRRESR